MYVDGVRQNQPFGDVVSWDLIPKDAISEVALIPGSDPLFGLNTLGGALSIQTKSGLTNPGWAGDVLYGSSGRKEVEGEWGGGKAHRIQLVSLRARISRIGLALRFAVRYPPRLRAPGLAHRQNRPRAHDVVRLQYTARQRRAGLPFTCTPLFQRLFDTRQHREPFSPALECDLLTMAKI